MRARPRRRDFRRAAARTASRKALAALQTVPRALRHHGDSRTCARSRPPPCATPPTARSSSTQAERGDRRADPAAVGRSRRRGSAALGVASSIHEPDGVVGDLGGGSLELTDVAARQIGAGVTLPLGGLSLMDVSERSPKKAARIARDALARVAALAGLAGRTFYAVGGTWRALARLHMRQRQYPMHVMHNYVIPSRDALEFAKLVERIEADALSAIESVSSARRPLLAYGAVVLEEIIRQYESARDRRSPRSACARGCCSRAFRRRSRRKDPLIEAASEFNRLRVARARARRGTVRTGRAGFSTTTHLEETRGGDAAAPRRLPALRHRLARPSRLSRRAVARHDRRTPT